MLFLVLLNFLAYKNENFRMFKILYYHMVQRIKKHYILITKSVNNNNTLKVSKSRL